MFLAPLNKTNLTQIFINKFCFDFSMIFSRLVSYNVRVNLVGLDRYSLRGTRTLQTNSTRTCSSYFNYDRVSVLLIIATD